MSLQNVSENEQVNQTHRSYVNNWYFLIEKDVMYWDIFRHAYLCHKKFILILIIGILIVNIVTVPTVVLQVKKAKNKLIIITTTTTTQSTEEKEFGKE